jgi:RecB family exonuclease
VDRWHTAQDSAEALGDALVAAIRGGADPSQMVVLIPDADLSVRMALSRVLRERGITELDPRDPLELRLGEHVKGFFRSLELASSDFERVKLLEWLRLDAGLSDNELAACAERLAQGGVRSGARAVGQALGDLLRREVLVRLEVLFEVSRGRILLSSLPPHARGPGQATPDARWSEWLERFWKGFESDLVALGQHEVRLPLSHWMERIRSRLEQSQSPPRRIRPVTGIRVVRASQCNPELRNLSVWVLGLPPQWLSVSAAASRVGDSYLRTRDRDFLGTEFAVHSAAALRDSRKRALVSWIAVADQLTILDHAYEADGSERESLQLLFKELGGSDDGSLALEITEHGAHARLLAGHALVTQARSREVRLAPRSGAKLSATELDALSRCPFLGAVQGRWKLKDAEDPELDLWPTTSGNLLHRSVELLVKDLEADPEVVRGAPREACARAVQRAWSEAREARKLQGWVESPQLAIQIERQMIERLGAFLEVELTYRDRSGVRVLAAEEDARLEWSFEIRDEAFEESAGAPRETGQSRSVTIRGKADRVDEHPQGLFVIDYKSGKQDVKGSDMRTLGYRLQLPFYAIAGRQKFQRPVLGVQFIELNRDARRSVGLFPASLNGKQAGSLTQVRSNNSSLFAEDPAEVWQELEGRIRDRVSAFMDGSHDARPVLGGKECENCRARLVCGEARREWVEGESS